MLGTALAQLRLALALLTGRPIPGWALSGLIAGALATRQEFGTLGSEAAETIAGPALDAEAQRDLQLRRFRSQAKRAAATSYYGPRFAALGLDPGKLTWEDIATFPLTPKEALRGDPDAFIHPQAHPVLRATTHGTTGEPTRIAFSASELRQMAGLAGLGYLLHGVLGPEDIVQINTASGALLGNWNLAAGGSQAGALIQPVGLIAPARTLALLARPLAIPGKKPKVSVLSTYPSYLGDLVETGLATGYGPADFGLERILTGGEIVTAGLKRRTADLFGEVAIEEGWAMSETFPFGAQRCAAGHLHSEPAHGLLEVLDPDTGQPAASGAVGVLVVTPFAPFRMTTPLLRYDTGDLVRVLPQSPTCALRQQPATSDLLGKRSLCVRHGDDLVTPRQVLEALEALEVVPLPARCGFRAVPEGVAVEVVVRAAVPQTHQAVMTSLEDHGVPVRELTLLTTPTALPQPYPWRGDLREQGFVTGLSRTP